jgi:hypothetical protein
MMIIALFVIAVVVSMPIAAVVVVSMASRREESAWSLGGPARGQVQAAARRILDFRSDDPALPLPKNCNQVRPAAPALRPAGQPRRNTVTGSPGPVATSKVSVRTAA